MTSRRGLHWLALATLLGTGCDKTLSFDPPEPSADGGEPGAFGKGGTAGHGFGGSLGGGYGGWSWGGSSGQYPPAAGGPGFFGDDDDCYSFCSSLDQRCHENEQACVECFNDDDCAPLGRYCDRGLNRCVACRDEFGCPDDAWCDNHGQCREPCLTEAHPADDCRDEAQLCDERRNVCISCREDQHCTGSLDGPYCLPGGARCVQCVADSDCRRETPRCDPVEFRCVECADSRDCELPYVCHPETHVCYDWLLGTPFSELR
jgi:hypothetical protein